MRPYLLLILTLLGALPAVAGDTVCDLHAVGTELQFNAHFAKRTDRDFKLVCEATNPQGQCEKSVLCVNGIASLRFESEQALDSALVRCAANVYRNEYPDAYIPWPRRFGRDHDSWNSDLRYWARPYHSDAFFRGVVAVLGYLPTGVLDLLRMGGYYGFGATKTIVKKVASPARTKKAMHHAAKTYATLLLLKTGAPKTSLKISRKISRSIGPGESSCFATN